MSKICTGDVRKELARDCTRTLERIINANLHRTDYYILVYAKWFEGNLVTKFVLISRSIWPLLGTMLIYINNKAGKAKLVWSLPLDIPLPDELFSKDSVEKVFDIAKSQKLPIQYAN